MTVLSNLAIRDIDTVTICPPLIIKADEIDALFARLSRALDRTLDWAKHENLRQLFVRA